MFEIAYRLPSPKTADDETVPIGVDHIDVVRIGLVQSDFGRVTLKKWASWVEAWKKKMSITFCPKKESIHL